MTSRTDQAVRIVKGRLTLEGLLGLPGESSGVVVFAHGSGSGRFSPRNNFVARQLQQNGLVTLLLDLLTEGEADDRRKVFDIDLLADRLLLTKAWLETEPRTKDLRIGYFGASTGAAAALVAASLPEQHVEAVVSRGGRPDLAGQVLRDIQAPTLLIVGELDGAVIGLNRSALERLPCPKEMVIVPGAGHLFEEPGALDQVVEHAARWFKKYLFESAMLEQE